MKLKDLNEILIEVDYILWKKKRAKEKEHSSLTDDYIKGYEDCLKSINDKIKEKIENGK